MPLTLVALFLARFYLLQLIWEVIVKRSLFSLTIHFRSIKAHVNCNGFVLCDGLAFILRKLAVNTAGSFCMVLPVQVFNYFFPSSIKSEEDKRMITKISLRFTKKKISLDDKSQYHKISGAQSSWRKMVWQPAGFRCLPASIDNLAIKLSIDEMKQAKKWVIHLVLYTLMRRNKLVKCVIGMLWCC